MGNQIFFKKNYVSWLMEHMETKDIHNYAIDLNK